MLICTIKNNLQFELCHQMLQQISLGRVTRSFQMPFFSTPQLKNNFINLPAVKPPSLLSRSSIF